MDCSIRPTKYPELFVITTTDFFYPLVDDPYMQGQIACANVLSDLYAIGVLDCDNLLMLLAASNDMPIKERDICTKLIIQGFNDQAKNAETIVTGGQTVVNPWPIIGGVGISTVKEVDFIRPENIKPGDKLVLTKALGTQLTVNVHQWMSKPRWEQVKDLVTQEEAIAAYEYAIDLMARLNRVGARLMHKYKAHGATDVTGFGILGHANNLAKNQKASVRFEIHTLPIIQKMKLVADRFTGFKLIQGFSAETSGGLLIGLGAEEAVQFCNEIEQIEGYPAWIIGDVYHSDSSPQENHAIISPNPHFIEVPFQIPSNL